LATLSDRRKSVENTFLGGEGTVNYYLADVTSRSEYYPYGMVLPGRSESDGENYRYGYQGSEADNEIKGHKNSYTTYFRQLDPQIGKWLSVDPKATAWESPYASMGNNPILNNDIYGDTFDPTSIYEKNEDGTYKNEAEVKAFEIWASSENGKKFILDHAEKGFELDGVFVKDLHIKANKNGKAHTKGVDVDFHYFTIKDFADRGGHLAEGTTGTNIVDGRLKITINLDPVGGTSLSGSEGKFYQPKSFMSTVRNITHETLYHANYFSKLFQSGRLSESNLKYHQLSEYYHKRGYLETDFYNTTGREVLNHASKFLYSKEPSNAFFIIQDNQIYIKDIHSAGKQLRNLNPLNNEVKDIIKKDIKSPPSKERINEYLKYGLE